MCLFPDIPKLPDPPPPPPAPAPKAKSVETPEVLSSRRRNAARQGTAALRNPRPNGGQIGF